MDTPLLCQHKDRPQHSSNTEENQVARTDFSYSRDLKVICTEEKGWVGGQSSSSTFRKALSSAGYTAVALKGSGLGSGVRPGPPEGSVGSVMPTQVSRGDVDFTC